MLINKSKVAPIYDIVLMFLALLSVVIVLAENRVSFSTQQLQLINAIDTGIWILFVADYFTRLALAEEKKEFVKTHIIELVAILPFNELLKGLRAFRILRSAKALRLLRITRLVSYFGRALNYADDFTGRHNFRYVLLLTSGIILLGAGMIVFFEKMSFMNALWWAFVTATTVGYGDISPSTIGGRIVAALLMISGIGFISILTGMVASFFMLPDEKKTLTNEVLSLLISRLEHYDTLTLKELEEINSLMAILIEQKKKTE